MGGVHNPPIKHDSFRGIKVTMTSSVLFWVFFSVAAALLMYGAIALGILRKLGRSPEEHFWLEVPLSKMRVRVPRSWRTRVEPHRLVVESGKKDGRLVIQALPAVPLSLTKIFNHEYADIRDPFHEEKIDDDTIVVENFARDPHTNERVYVEMYLSTKGAQPILATYKSSVLFGLVDTYQVHDIVRSLSSSHTIETPNGAKTLLHVK
jgi:hypothetical protein